MKKVNSLSLPILVAKTNMMKNTNIYSKWFVASQALQRYKYNRNLTINLVKTEAVKV